MVFLGKSNAFEISKKLGVPSEIIEKANSYLSSQEIHFEDLLKKIYDDKSMIEKEKSDIDKELNQITLLRKSLERDNQTLRKQEEDLINNAKIKARNILLDAKEEANEIIKKMNTLSKEVQDSNYGMSSYNGELSNLRNTLNTKIKDIKLEQTIDTATTDSSSILKPEDVFQGMKVFVTALNQNGTVLSHVSKSNEVQVQIGSMKTNINIKFLKSLANNNLNNSSNKNLNVSKSGKSSSTSGKNNSNLNNTASGSYSYANISKTKNVKSEINIIGYNVDEAIFVVDKFLDDASLARLNTIRIVHGKGTGKLRNGIHKFLKTNPHVKSFRIGAFGEGEMGVTVVELK